MLLMLSLSDLSEEEVVMMFCEFMLEVEVVVLVVVDVTLTESI